MFLVLQVIAQRRSLYLDYKETNENRLILK